MALYKCLVVTCHCLQTASGRVTPSGVDAQLFSNSGRRTPSADVFPPPFPANGGAPPGVLQAERHVSSAFGPEYRLSQTATTGRVTSGEKKSVSPKSRTQVSVIVNYVIVIVIAISVMSMSLS